jgi:hypothetical protein
VLWPSTGRTSDTIANRRQWSSTRLRDSSWPSGLAHGCLPRPNGGADRRDPRTPGRLPPAAHADPAVDAPDRDRNSGVIEGLLPGEDMLVDAVDERAVQVEHEELISHELPLPRSVRERRLAHRCGGVMERRQAGSSLGGRPVGVVLVRVPCAQPFAQLTRKMVSDYSMCV